MLKAVTIAATLALSALGATASQSAVIMEPLAAGGFVIAPAKSAFSYDFSITVPTAGLFTFSLTSSTSKIKFTSVTFNGSPITKIGGNFYSLDEDGVDVAAGAQMVHIAGANALAGATFSTSYGFTSTVPEPAAWGMMVVGFGALGATMRRRPVAGIANA